MQQTIEMVGNDSLTFSIVGQSAGASDELGNETALGFVGRQDSFVDAEHMQLPEVDVSGLKQSHDLKSVGATAV